MGNLRKLKAPEGRVAVGVGEAGGRVDGEVAERGGGGEGEGRALERERLELVARQQGARRPLAARRLLGLGHARLDALGQDVLVVSGEGRVVRLVARARPEASLRRRQRPLLLLHRGVAFRAFALREHLRQTKTTNQKVPGGIRKKLR